MPTPQQIKEFEKAAAAIGVAQQLLVRHQYEMEIIQGNLEAHLMGMQICSELRNANQVTGYTKNLQQVNKLALMLVKMQAKEPKLIMAMHKAHQRLAKAVDNMN